MSAVDRTPEIPVLNIRTLAYFFSQMMDSRIDELRAGTPFAGLRHSDVRVFVAASRNNRTASEIARALRITRQSVQSSIRRLQETGLVDLAPHSISKRDKLVRLTQKGIGASGLALQVLDVIEGELVAALGAADYAAFKSTLAKLLSTYRGGEFLPRIDTGIQSNRR